MISWSGVRPPHSPHRAQHPASRHISTTEYKVGVVVFAAWSVQGWQRITSNCRVFGEHTRGLACRSRQRLAMSLFGLSSADFGSRDKPTSFPNAPMIWLAPYVRNTGQIGSAGATGQSTLSGSQKEGCNILFGLTSTLRREGIWSEHLRRGDSKSSATVFNSEIDVDVYNDSNPEERPIRLAS